MKGRDIMAAAESGEKWRAVSVRPAGAWPPEEALDEVVLAFDQRYRRRVLLKTVKGREVLLDLPHAACLGEGDGLALASGGWIRVRAASELLLEVSAPPLALLRIAWHLGNRHVPVEIATDRLRLHPDHVLAEMIAQLGGECRTIEAPFTPELGAYAEGHTHGHP
jgi:urease accessory protein